MKELKISAIREGTVIDHIPSYNTFKVAEILNLKEHKNIVSIATNLKSKKIGKKGLIKVGGKSLSEDDVNKIALIAPYATISIIKDYEVVKKFKPKPPEIIERIVKCSNPRCITNAEKIKTKFKVIKREPLKVRCYYCERTISSDEIQLL